MASVSAIVKTEISVQILRFNDLQHRPASLVAQVVGQVGFVSIFNMPNRNSVLGSSCKVGPARLYLI